MIFFLKKYLLQKKEKNNYFSRIREEKNETFLGRKKIYFLLKQNFLKKVISEKGNTFKMF